MTQRWKLTLEYDGTNFCGWQRQENALSVQEVLEKAVFGFCAEQVTSYAAGRTDSGVHALGQVAHIDLEKDADEKTVRDAINFHLRPHPVAVVRAQKTASDFHARTSARKRVYCYKILSARWAEPVIAKNRVWHVPRALDLAAMNKAAAFLLGEHDFTSFRASECQAASPVKTLDRLDITEVEDAMFGRHLQLWAEARSFLHHQIRNITGTLKLVGEGKWMPEQVQEALAAKDRTKAGPMAPACGLYFVRVEYNETPILNAIDSLL